MKKMMKMTAMLLALSVLVGVTAEAKESTGMMKRETRKTEGTIIENGTSEPDVTVSPSSSPQPGETVLPQETPEVTDAPEEVDTIEVAVAYITGSLKLSWQGNDDWQEVVIEKDSIGNVYQIAENNEVLLEVEEGEISSYRVVAYDSEKNKVASSEWVKAGKPQKITSLKTTGIGKSKLKLKWNKCEGANGYIVYQKIKEEYRQYKITTMENCTVKKLKEGKNYIFRVVPYTEYSVFVKGTGKSVRYSNKEIVATKHKKYSYKEMSADIKALQKKYDGLVTYNIIGKSEDNRNIYDVVVGNPNAKKVLLVVSALHAREYMTSLLSMKQIEYYLEKYYGKIAGKSVKENLQKVAIHYIPMANPDGVTISQYGKGAIRDSSLRRALYKMSGNATRWKANARGVDLNRNFPDKFNVYGKRSGQGYSGPSVASESETKAIIHILNDLKQDNRLKGVVNYHAMGSIIFGDTKGNATVRKNTTKMYQLAKAITGYASAAGYKSSVPGSGGSLREYIMRKKQVASITLEIGRIYCPGPIREFPNIWKRNKTLVFREAALFA